MFHILCEKHPFIKKMYESHKRDNLPTLLNPDDDNDINSMTYIMKTDLLRQLFLEPKYNKIVNPQTGIEIIINNTQLQKAELSLGEKNIDPADFRKHLDRYKDALFSAYEKYGRKGERKWPMRLQDINDMSRDYTQRPIIYADKEYWVFQMFQYKIYEHLKAYIITNNTTDYKTYIDNVWNVELDKLINVISRQYYTRKNVPETTDPGRVNFYYYKNIFENLPIYVDFRKHIYITLNDKLQDERKNGVKYEENDDKLLEEYVKIKSSEQPDQKQEDKSYIYAQYKTNKTLSDDELKEINLTSDEFDEQRLLMHYVHPYYDVCKEQIEEKYENLLCSFENPKMILELRQLQIKVNYLFYVIASQLYDAYIWQTTDTNIESQQEYLFEKLKQNDLYANENIDLYEQVYSEIILYFNVNAAGEYKANQVKGQIMEFIRIYKEGLLKQIKEKYLVDKRNINLFIVLKTHRFYLLYEDNIQKKINDLYENLMHLIQNNSVMFDTINDPKYLVLYLRFKHGLWTFNDKEFLKEKKEYLRDFDIMEGKIFTLSSIYRQYKGDETKNTSLYHELFDYGGMTPERCRFVYKANRPLVETLNYGNQTDLEQFDEGIDRNPLFSTAPYNVGCEYFADIMPLLKEQRHTVYGFTRNILKFKSCRKDFVGNNALWYIARGIWYKNFSLESHFDLSFGSNILDHLRVYVDLHRGHRELIFADDVNNSARHAHYVDEKHIINNSIKYMCDNTVYLGMLKIPTRRHNFVIMFIVWDCGSMCFELYEVSGGAINMSIILYSPYSTYHELRQMVHDYKSHFYELPRNLGYAVTKDKRDDKKETQFCIIHDDEKKAKYGNYSRIGIGVECQPIMVGGSSIPIIMTYVDPQYIMNIYKKQLSIGDKIATFYYNLFMQGISVWYYDMLKLVNQYSLLFNNRTISHITIYNTGKNIIDFQNTSILYYKSFTRNGIYLWMIQHIYKIINSNTHNIYEINTTSHTGNIFRIINDKYYPKNNFECNFICPKYTSGYDNKSYVEDINTKDINATFCDTQQIFLDSLNNIKRIDFLYINLLIFWHCGVKIGFMKYIISVNLLWIICLLCDKITNKSSICIRIGYSITNVSLKIYTLIAYLFEEFYIYTPEINAEYDNDIFLILKNKKNNIGHYELYLKELYKDLGKNIPDLYTKKEYIDVCGTDRTVDRLVLLSTILKDKIIDDIQFKNKEYKKLYKKIRKEIKSSNRKFYKQIKNIYAQCKELHKKITKNPEHDYKTEYYKKNLYACIQWSKKYDFPLIEQITDMTQVLKKDILQDMLTYEQPVLFKFKKNDAIKKISADTLEKFFNKAISKYFFEIRALDTRDMNVYHQVKLRIDYYHHKLIKEIKKKYNIKGFITQAWIKLLEIYSVIDIIPKNAKTFKSFHFCELPGAFIYATKFFIKTKTQIKDWQWKAQSLNPGSLSETDKRKAFGDDAGILKKYGEHYDFGNGSGDINDPENLEYYKTNCNDNDFVTADCGLPLSQKNISNILTLSMFLSVLSVLKNGGSCIIKRYVPIDNAQEIFLLNLFYNSFEQTIAYKPRVNQQSQEYYIIGIGYNRLNNTLETLETLQKNYVEITNIDDVQEPFLLQLDKMQHIILDNFNKHIKNKIYFADNFTKLTDDDWKMINTTSKDKINEWLELIK